MNKTFRIPLPPDYEGFTGRECPTCRHYFKIKFENYVPSNLYCPYCSQYGDIQQFLTEDQIAYAKSVGIKKIMEEVIEPRIKRINRNLRTKSIGQRGGLFQIKIETKFHKKLYSINYYQEKELKTKVNCQNCNLIFAIYGKFARCPNCSQLNALKIFQKSIEVSEKRIDLSMGEKDQDLIKAFLEDALTSAVSAFDAYGKELRYKYPRVFPNRPKNLFQNLNELDKVIKNKFGKTIDDLIGKTESLLLFKMFQVRHIYQHNLGVIDHDFVKKVKNCGHLQGQIYDLSELEIKEFLSILLKLGEKIYDLL
ncbi:MAG: hypothetical protein ACTSPV_19505 [Candidatus Hodarchaeales archaeon]